MGSLAGRAIFPILLAAANLLAMVAGAARALEPSE